VNLNDLWTIADYARVRPLTTEEKTFVRDTLPRELAAYPHIERPARIHHPAGFSVSGAPTGTFLRCALLLAGQRAVGKRYTDALLYQQVEKDLAFSVMRSHFHNGYPRGAHCCGQCTLAVYTVLVADAIHYFNGPELAPSVRALIENRQWRFAGKVNPSMIAWALGEPDTYAR
jgi:hypothetical protein